MVKQLNKNATKIFNKIVKMMNDEGYIKINNSEGIFMPLSAEKNDKVSDGELISFAHYFEQNGDLVQDPEMIFLALNEDMIFPVSIQHSFGRLIEGIVFENGELKGVYPNQQEDMTSFANMWLKNIKEQQGIK